MYLGEETVKKTYVRKSKLGKEHTYTREKRIVWLRCDCCGETFGRERQHMDPKRLSNNYFHVCALCDAKRFAQKKGVERKHIWDLKASSDMPIGKI